MNSKQVAIQKLTGDLGWSWIFQREGRKPIWIEMTPEHTMCGCRSWGQNHSLTKPENKMYDGAEYPHWNSEAGLKLVPHVDPYPDSYGRRLGEPGYNGWLKGEFTCPLERERRRTFKKQVDKILQTYKVPKRKLKINKLAKA